MGQHIAQSGYPGPMSWRVPGSAHGALPDTRDEPRPPPPRAGGVVARAKGGICTGAEGVTGSGTTPRHGEVPCAWSNLLLSEVVNGRSAAGGK
jgi:hypothetical protein